MADTQPKSVWLPNIDALAASAAQEQRFRALQQDISPTAIKPRLAGEIIQTPGQSTTAAVPMSNGDHRIFQIFVRDSGGARLEATTITGFFVNSPGLLLVDMIGAGGTVDATDWQVIGPFHSFYFFDAATVSFRLTDYAEDIIWYSLTNISAGTVDVYFSGVPRYIINQGPPAQS